MASAGSEVDLELLQAVLQQCDEFAYDPSIPCRREARPVARGSRDELVDRRDDWRTRQTVACDLESRWTGGGESGRTTRERSQFSHSDVPSQMVGAPYRLNSHRERGTLRDNGLGGRSESRTAASHRGSLSPGLPRVNSDESGSTSNLQLLA